ncbi:MAG: DUF5320 domain-containing protein [Anaerolineae bacterium]|jgi:hypothetical protein|nr:DUF5320 domain-containing protein [Anaerolineae bacterium]MBT7189883.1 DUF5320 domain-containing protein [Anaerolineae bacterium]MBT7991683.1 DUF5320 domain-containing protein [Anaerolineae bacterium]
MPYKNGMGPAGKGSRTGRGAGNCTGQGGTGRFGGRGRGRGGRGMGRDGGYTSDQHNSWLEDQVKSLQAALQSITERLDAMKKD